MEAKNYYSLKFIGNSPYHQSGDVLKTADCVLTIGESADCDIRFEKPEDCANELYYATISKVEGRDEWVLIKRSTQVDVRVIGREEFAYMTTLQNNDVIEFGHQKQSLRFALHHDSHYSQAGTTVVKKSNSPLFYGLFALIFFALVGLYFISRPREIPYEDIQSMEDAVLRIEVDSVAWIQLVNGDETCLNMMYCDQNEGGKSIGTAFLTQDSCLLTARHCVEYWLGNPLPLNADIDELSDLDIRKWAILVETYNYTHESQDTVMALRSYVSLYDKNGKYLTSFTSATSDNRFVDRSRDGILTYDNFINRYYGRSITPYFVNRDMELGDIFCMPLIVPGIKSEIKLADSTFIHSLKKTTPLAFLGYPASEYNDHKLIPETGKMTDDYRTKEQEKDHNLIHNGELNHGFSGGPVFAKDNLDYVVVGVISKVDSIDNNRKMSVPVSVIKKGGKK